VTDPILGNFHDPMVFSMAIQGVLLHKMERRRIALFHLVPLRTDPKLID